MGALKEKLRERYTTLTQDMQQVHVPEWETDFYVAPVTIAQAAIIDSEVDDYRRAARIVQVRAKKADGSRMFDDEDFEAMITHGEAELVGRVARSIMKTDRTREEIEKK